MAKVRVTPINLRPRAGLNPTRVRLPDPAGTEYRTVQEYLLARFPTDANRISELFSSCQVYDDTGNAILPATAYQPNKDVYLFRDPPPDEPKVAALSEITIIYEDEDLLVIDKPHLVSVIPRGRWVTQTALVYLRNKHGLPDLSPVHRLDRPTAGVLVFTKRPEIRGAYQMLFQERQVQKQYLAVTAAPPPGSLLAKPENYPMTVQSRIVKLRGVAPAQEVPGLPNAETEIELLGIRPGPGLPGSEAGLALWSLKPKTGKTHQLRVHLNSLGLPIIGDPFWPELKPETDPEPQGEAAGPPLQLLAKVIEFIDPFTGEQKRFESRRTLNCWE